jgi:uncharacterized membrane protein YkvA (DUF1232 family)
MKEPLREGISLVSMLLHDGREPIDCVAAPPSARSWYGGYSGSYAEMVRTLLIALGIVAGVWVVSIVALLVIGRRTAARQLATLLPNLVRLFRALLRDSRVPTGTKILLGLAIAWFVWPIDLVPEFIPVLGPLDDAVVAALVLRHVLRKAGRDVIAEHWSGDQATLDVLLRVAGAR